MSLSSRNSISIGRWSEPSVWIRVQAAENKKDCDSRDVSAEDYCASEL